MKEADIDADFYRRHLLVLISRASELPGMVSTVFLYALHIVGLAIAALADVRPPVVVEFPSLLIDKHAELDSVQSMNEIMQNFFAGSNSTTLERWYKALPTAEEKMQMKELVADLLEADEFHNYDDLWFHKKYPKLAESMCMTILKKGQYVMVHERRTVTGKFARMWGYIVVANKRSFKRPIHHSAAHFQSDGDVCNEAASVFEQTKSRTLVVAGASRYAVKGDNRSPCQKSYQIADAAHSCATMFQAMNLAVLSAVNRSDRAREDVFIQWHGMGEKSCSASPVFISTGAHGMHPIYNITSIPANRLVSRLNLHMGQVVAHTPRTDSTCKLVATSNVFGRAIYGVPIESVCDTRAKDEDITGHFVHIEQKRKFRDSWNVWADVVNAVF
ncbi:hypothetical protein QR680_002426 [Steinernema hermaphroditum]|uniref:Uncharacterized protein n=1 Tax=Steinernema hermaphroditum TaxID=289476 RepID=A0AA39H4F4_9BILA|nr:hypothetical protein QR680_002426 [Steinernema hermaphroditum]